MSPCRVLWCVALCAVGVASLAIAAPLRVLILSGENNHDWRTTTPVLKATLEQEGLCEVAVTENVAQLRPRDLEGISIVLSNYNTFGKKNAASVWGAEMRAAFIEWIRRGHGFVAVHAGSSVFYDWPEFQALGGTAWGKTSHHAKIHASEVVFLPVSHPITTGLSNFSTTDEFWEGCVFAAGTIVLATVTPNPEFVGCGQPQPIALTTTLGDGRGFTLLLGHNAESMQNEGFKILLRRGTVWAANGPSASTFHATTSIP